MMRCHFYRCVKVVAIDFGPLVAELHVRINIHIYDGKAGSSGPIKSNADCIYYDI